MTPKQVALVQDSFASLASTACQHMNLTVLKG
jgi:hypothetical protein